MLNQLIPLAVLVILILTSPLDSKSTAGPALSPRVAQDVSSFIALGESYAAGVGAGTPDQSLLRSRCLRYDQAYPRLFARDSGVPGTADESRLINNACSGQKIPEILAKQFGDTDSDDQDKYKAFGKPQFAMISAAGDDVQFKELVLSCIYEYPYKPRPCQEQINISTGILNSDDFFSSIQKLISTALDKGLANHNDFKIYYLGYAQFFNTGPTSPDFCSQKTWSLCKPWQRKCEKLVLDVPLRTQLNGLATLLNSKIKAAVDSFKRKAVGPDGEDLVKFVDIDTMVQGHRYCEQDKQEPVKNDDDIWFFQWLDDETTNDDAKHEFYDELARQLSHLPDIETFQDYSMDGTLVIDASEFLEGEIQIADTNTTLATEIDAEGALLNRVKTFHPKIVVHQMIENTLRDLINADMNAAINFA